MFWPDDPEIPMTSITKATKSCSLATVTLFMTEDSWWVGSAIDWSQVAPDVDSSALTRLNL